jgi:hypothetical protein
MPMSIVMIPRFIVEVIFAKRTFSVLGYDIRTCFMLNNRIF